MKKLLFALFLIIASNSTIKADDNVAFFFFNCKDTTYVEDEFIKMEIIYRYYATEDSRNPSFSAILAVTNKTDQPLYLDTGNSFFYQNKGVICMYTDKTTKMGDVTVQNKRIIPVAPNSVLSVWKYAIKDPKSWSDTQWYVGLFPNKTSKPGTIKNFSEEDSPLKLRAILTYSLSEDMEDAKQIETRNFIQQAIVDAEPDPIKIQTTQGGKQIQSSLSGRKKGENKTWNEYKFNFRKCKFAQKNYNAFYYIPLVNCDEEKVTKKSMKKMKANEGFIR